MEEEQLTLRDIEPPLWRITFNIVGCSPGLREATERPRVLVLREEGSNGDREMGVALNYVGFETWDITMSDLLAGRANLDMFKGLIFPGGFSYADVLDSGKGWAGTIRFSKKLLEQFQEFYDRDGTFSLGVCNGCQLMALLGWVPGLSDGSRIADVA